MTAKNAKGQPHKWGNEVQAWRFPQLLDIARHWLVECVTCKGNTFPQLLLTTEFAHDASDQPTVRTANAASRDRSYNRMTRSARPAGSTST